MSTQLESLKQFTTVVADTGDFDSIKDLKPTDATTNPSLILKAVMQDKYQPLLDEIIQSCKGQPYQQVVDQILVSFGKKILEIIPGRVSTEVDARLSFDTAATVKKAEEIIGLYKNQGIDPSRVLIKIAGTWEGIQAVAELEKRGIHCNVTLLFSLVQAIASAEAGAKLISPFVGRIYDWYKKAAGSSWNEEASAGINDPGVKSVSEIFRFYKQHGIDTEIMGASFRNKGQILALAGCDLLTISPQLLGELADSTEAVEQVLSNSTQSGKSKTYDCVSEAEFRFALNENAMATEKLAEGIRTFMADARKLDNLIQSRLNG